MIHSIQNFLHLKSAYQGLNLCHLICYSFLLEISIRGPREIRNANYLTMILLLHVCLMECSENLRVRQKLIQCGCIYLLLKELRNMTRVIQTDRDSNKVTILLINLTDIRIALFIFAVFSAIDPVSCICSR